MAFQSLVRETSTTTGTGDFTTAAATGWRSLSGAFSTGSSNTFRYTIRHTSASPTEWEDGIGYMNDSTTLKRTTILASSNSNNAVNFSSGTKEVVATAHGPMFGGMNASDKIPGGLISEVVTTSSQSSISFSSIAATYRDLELVIRGRGTASATSVFCYAQFNTDSGSNYDLHRLNRFGTTGVRATTVLEVGELPAATAPSNVSGLLRTLIGDYRGTTFYKPVTGQSWFTIGTATGDVVVDLDGGTWRSTSAITGIVLTLSSGNFVDGTVASLYGRM